MDAHEDRDESRESLYQRLIMERARQPHHAGLLDPADRQADGNNPFCGDKVHVTLSLSPNGRVDRVLHRTRGCAICVASADLMAEAVTGMDGVGIHSLSGRFDAMLHAGPNDPAASLGLLDAFENLHEYRSRIRCATLPWAALLDALKSEETI